MTQRKCGTCRYFEEGGIAASGWCRHPERQELQHMVLVRKTELACRDGWDHDLWEPNDGSGGKGGGSGGSGGYQQRAHDGQAIGEEPLKSRDGGERHSRGDTLQVSEGYSSPRARTPGQAVRTRPSGSSPATGDYDPERERYPDGYASDASASDFDPSRRAEQPDEIREETFSTRRSPNANGASDAPRTVDPPESNSLPWDSARTPDRNDLNPFNGRGGTTPEGFGAPRYGAFEQGGRGHGYNETPEEEQEPGPVEQSGLTEPFDVTEPETDMTEPNQDQGDEVAGSIFDAEDETYSDVSTREADEDGSREGLNIPVSLQQEQCCRTCRDFRPADGGRRGWCKNPFAFEQRQQVEAEDLACQGTFGNWWSPTDDWWIERADISHHSTPTPLVNDLIREVQEQKGDERGSTEKRTRS